ncbi:unnamed protein product [Blepharisma stoltei]|uniref:Uncharacterized protein n=1 Tax=Blepharisma stoltei TaxID=1481888 RepID=A0AAU9IGL4_9CILI|nr:unnamed protein product [Blepharisma stoltei]
MLISLWGIDCQNEEMHEDLAISNLNMLKSTWLVEFKTKLMRPLIVLHAKLILWVFSENSPIRLFFGHGSHFWIKFIININFKKFSFPMLFLSKLNFLTSLTLQF